MVAAAVALVLGTSAHAGLVPLGDDFSIAAGSKRYAAGARVAADSAGGFVVAWQSTTTPATSDWDIRGRRYDANGTPLGRAFAVNTYTTGFQEYPAVAISDTSEFIVAWSGRGRDEQYGAFARIYAADGAPEGPQVRLHGPTETVFEHVPSAAAVGDAFLVAWLEQERIAGVAVESTAEITPRFAVEAAAPKRVALDAVANDGFVVVWSTSEYRGGGFAGGYLGIVQGQEFGADGTPGQDFQVNVGRDDPTGYGFVIDGNRSLAVAAGARGDFVVGFDSYVADYYYNVDAHADGYENNGAFERFSADVTQGGEVTPIEPSRGRGPQIAPDVAMTPGGNAVAVWSDGLGIFARAIDCHGADQTNGVVQINSDTTGNQIDPSVAVNEAGELVVVWHTSRASGGGYAVAGRRFALTGGCALCGDADVNGRVTATDALATLLTSVSLSTCALDRCDADGSATVTANDALRILVAVAANDVAGLACDGAT